MFPAFSLDNSRERVYLGRCLWLTRAEFLGDCRCRSNWYTRIDWPQKGRFHPGPLAYSNDDCRITVVVLSATVPAYLVPMTPAENASPPGSPRC